MKSFIFVLALFTTQLCLGQSISIKQAAPKITVNIGGKATTVQSKKTVVLDNGYYVEKVVPKTLEEITKNMTLVEGKHKFNGQDQVVYQTSKGVLYAIIKTESGYIKKKIG